QALAAVGEEAGDARGKTAGFDQQGTVVEILTALLCKQRMNARRFAVGDGVAHYGVTIGHEIRPSRADAGNLCTGALRRCLARDGSHSPSALRGAATSGWIRFCRRPTANRRSCRDRTRD